MGDHAMEQEIQELKLEAPRVTREQILAILDTRISYRIEQPAGTTSTFAHAFLDERFYLASGHTACVSLENFNAALGEKYAVKQAREKAEGKLWELEGYALYVSQLPKPETTYVQRMQAELTELVERLTQLRAFVHTPTFEALAKDVREDLLEQSQAMMDYRDVLNRRVIKAMEAV